LRIYENVTVPSKVIEKHILTTCDLCGKKAVNGDWESSTYEVNEVEVRIEVRYKDGKAYPDCSWGDKFQADICPVCFKNKLIPWLESQGCTAEVEEWEW
jgi:hypothetical protein